MWFLAVGLILVVAAIFGKKFGLKIYSTGRPGARGEPDTSWSGRIFIGALGVAFIWMGMGDLLK
jgi:hypothetical protein